MAVFILSIVKFKHNGFIYFDVDIHWVFYEVNFDSHSAFFKISLNFSDFVIVYEINPNNSSTSHNSLNSNAHLYFSSL